MRFSESWLREWVDPPVDTRGLVDQLTRAGLEVDSVEPAASPGGFSGVVVADVVECRPHPNADRLKVCVVDSGWGEPVEVVCGAPNAQAGMRAALARPGARIGGGVKVRRSKIRGTVSEGMLCSMRELGIGEDHDGIIHLEADAPPGAEVFALLGLDDSVIEVSVTPDRGDCLCLAGIAREVAAVNGLPASGPDPEPVAPAIEDRLPVSLEAPEGCARYAGRAVRGIDPGAKTPLWMSERLRRCGVRVVSPIVDVTNYVMLELGQPLHAFDLHRLEGGIKVRRARAGERLTLLDEQEIELRPSTLVIADHRRPVALAGIMGGLDTAVSGATRDVFLESAWFSPSDLMGEPRFYKLNTDASHRFERGVDPALQRTAIERATRLLVDIAGGRPGAIVDEAAPSHLPRRPAVRLRPGRIERLLGMDVPSGEVAGGLRRLGMGVAEVEGGWSVTPPTHRFDIAIEEDLIEEVVRLAGYDRVPPVEIEGIVRPGEDSETGVPVGRLRRLMVDRGVPRGGDLQLRGPGAASVSRPGRAPDPARQSHLFGALRDAHPHVDGAVRGARTQRQSTGAPGPAVRDGSALPAGLRAESPDRGPRGVGQPRPGTRLRTSIRSASSRRSRWVRHTPSSGEAPRGGVDFFDLKSDIEALLGLTGQPDRFSFAPFVHPALHPAQTAVIRDADTVVGLIGALHPRVRRELGLPAPVFVFEIALAALASARIPGYEPVSRFPSVRRDIAVIVDDEIPADQLLDAVRRASSDILHGSLIFDLYQDERIGAGRKSVGIGLTFRSDSRTLDDTEVDGVIERIVTGLEADLGAGLRK